MEWKAKEKDRKEWNEKKVKQKREEEAEKRIP